MMELDHPNIVKLYFSFADTKHLYLIVELLSGGELFRRLRGVLSYHFSLSLSLSICLIR
jgi:serine/threonine protein kinase